MKIEQLYLTEVVPFLKNFIYCDIYKYELIKISQELADSLNEKNIYTALDKPDFKHLKDKKIEQSVLRIVCKKLKLANSVEEVIENGLKLLILDGVKYQLYLFPTSTVPEINIKFNKAIYFMYQPEFKKVYYCGKQNIGELNSDILNDFYLKNCYNGTKKFINFKNLLL